MPNPYQLPAEAEPEPEDFFARHRSAVISALAGFCLAILITATLAGLSFLGAYGETYWGW